MLRKERRLDAVRHGKDLQGHGGVENVGAVAVLQGGSKTGQETLQVIGDCDGGTTHTCRNVCTQSLERIFTTALCRRSNRPIRHVIFRQETLVQFCRETGSGGGVR